MSDNVLMPQDKYEPGQMTVAQHTANGIEPHYPGGKIEEVDYRSENCKVVLAHLLQTLANKGVLSVEDVQEITKRI